MVKSGEMWQKVVTIGAQRTALGRVVDQKWRKVAKSGKKCQKVVKSGRKVAKSGEKWHKMADK